MIFGEKKLYLPIKCSDFHYLLYLMKNIRLEIEMYKMTKKNKAVGGGATPRQCFAWAAQLR